MVEDNKKSRRPWPDDDAAIRVGGEVTLLDEYLRLVQDFLARVVG